MRIPIRTSKWATWSRRLASLAIPLLVIPVVLHREGGVESSVFAVILAIAGFVALGAFVAAVIGLARLWQSGDQGWGRAIFGLFVSLVCLSPFLYGLAMFERYPRATDVATGERALMPLVLDGATSAMTTSVMLPTEARLAAFPGAATRDYPLNAEQMFDLANRLVTARGWTVMRSVAPVGPQGEGMVNARLMTLLGWRDEVVVRVEGGSDGARVDMRSVALGRFDDLGANGTRIENFLTALDGEVATQLRDNPNVTEPVLEAPTEPLETDIEDDAAPVG